MHRPYPVGESVSVEACLASAKRIRRGLEEILCLIEKMVSRKSLVASCVKRWRNRRRKPFDTSSLGEIASRITNGVESELLRILREHSSSGRAHPLSLPPLF